MQLIMKFQKRLIVYAVILTLALAAGGMGIANAQQGQRSDDRHSYQAEPEWEEIDREIRLNPDRPAPPEVTAQLVSLSVTYRDFNGRQKQGIVEVNRAHKDDVLTFFRYAYYLNFPFHKVAVSSDQRYGWDDNKLMEANVTSCFNYRTIAGTDRPSQHGQGNACDINPRQNPYITLDDAGNPVVQPAGAAWNLGAPGTLHTDHPLIQLMESRGWTWGGRWTLQDLDGAVIDYQHLQKRPPATAAADLKAR